MNILKYALFAALIGIASVSPAAEKETGKTECKVETSIVRGNQKGRILQMELQFSGPGEPVNYMLQGIRKNLPAEFLNHVKPSYIWKNKNPLYERYNLGDAPFVTALRREKKGKVQFDLSNYPTGKYELTLFLFVRTTGPDGKKVVNSIQYPLTFTLE